MDSVATMRPMISTVVPVLALTLTLTACSGPADPNLAMCDAFAHYLQEAGSVEAMDREATVDQVGLELAENQGDVDTSIASGLSNLEAAAEANDSAWTLAADTMAAACADYGWTAG